MRAPKLVIILWIVAVTSGALISQSPPGSDQSAPAKNNNLRIVAPANGQKLSVNYVNVQYQITNPAAAPNNLPTFQVSLDGHDPVITSVLAHTFTGLAPGEHTISVQMIDANSLPVAGTQAEVRFVVLTPQQTTPARTPGGTAQVQPTEPQLQEAGSTQDQRSPEVLNASVQGDLPSTSSGLPLLSVIGFGVLVGGIASALKTR